MIAYRIIISLDDFLFFASKELRGLYISERYIHNYALTYALGLVTSTYRDKTQIPHYQEDLEPLNDISVYVTPAKPLAITTSIHSMKFANVNYRALHDNRSINIPKYGKVREISPESVFEAFVFSEKTLKLPSWIRLGKWMSKAHIQAQQMDTSQSEGAFTTLHPLNALDTELKPQLYDLINMPPVSLINNARFEGKHFKVKVGDKETRDFPAELRYTF